MDSTEISVMDSTEISVLEACRELVLRQGELLPLLADAIDVPESEVFHTWALRKCGQRGRLEGTDWAYYFHGLECDLDNESDGRHVRIDFGPKGRVDTFTSWGVLQFIMTSAFPWTEFPHLAAALVEGEPPYNQYSASLGKLLPVWDRLEAKGCFERAAPNLIEFTARHSTIGPDGITYVRYPADTSEELSADCSVAHRQRLSPKAVRILDRLLMKRS